MGVTPVRSHARNKNKAPLVQGAGHQLVARGWDLSFGAYANIWIVWHFTPPPTLPSLLSPSSVCQSCNMSSLLIAAFTYFTRVFFFKFTYVRLISIPLGHVLTRANVSEPLAKLGVEVTRRIFFFFLRTPEDIRDFVNTLDHGNTCLPTWTIPWPVQWNLLALGRFHALAHLSC